MCFNSVVKPSFIYWLSLQDIATNFVTLCPPSPPSHAFFIFLFFIAFSSSRRVALSQWRIDFLSFPFLFLQILLLSKHPINLFTKICRTSNKFKCDMRIRLIGCNCEHYSNFFPSMMLSLFRLMKISVK